MFENHHILLAALTGFISGVLLSVPVGPINITIINEGARNGFRWALMIGLGAVTMEVVYCTIAFTGFASFFSRGIVKAMMELGSFVFMLYLGLKFMLTKTVSGTPKIMPNDSNLEEIIEERVEKRLHPHSAFMIGLVRVFGNPGVLFFWVVLAANFISREWVEPNGTGKLACISGVAAGTSLWFVGLSWAASLGHKKFTDSTLLRIQHFSGLSLILLAVGHGGHIVWQMARTRM